MDNIKIGPFDVVFTRKNIKNLRISISHQDGCIKISAPKNLPMPEIEKFVLKKSKWIESHQAKGGNLKKSLDYKFEEKELHPLWGELLPITFKDDFLYLSIKLKKENPQRSLDLFYRDEIIKNATPIFNKYQKIMGVTANELRIKKMKTRWGSCNTEKKRIWLSLNLVKYPKKCLELVIVHELCHLIEKPHSAYFYSLMDKYLPDRKTTEKALKHIPGFDNF